VDWTSEQSKIEAFYTAEELCKHSVSGLREVPSTWQGDPRGGLERSGKGADEGGNHPARSPKGGGISQKKREVTIQRAKEKPAKKEKGIV